MFSTGEVIEKSSREVLVVVDKEPIRLFLSNLLVADGWNVWLAGSAEDVIPFLLNKNPIVAFVDLDLSEKSGSDLWRQIKRVLPKTEVILITADASLNRATKALEDGAYAYLREPFKRESEETLELMKRAFEKNVLFEENQRLLENEKHVSLLLWGFTQNMIQQDLRVQSLTEQIKKESIHDLLTGLYNRSFFDYRIKKEIARAKRNGSSLAFLLCDLDHFKTINDTLGRQTGDEILKRVARSVQESLRETDLVFRWGGDEIAVVLPETSREGIQSAADRIIIEVRKIGAQVELPLDISIGASLHPEHGDGIDKLVSLANRALHIAKNGGDKLHIGDHEYVLDDQSVKMVFQPVVDTRSNQIIGYEALARDPDDRHSIQELFKRYQAIGQLADLKEICFRSQLKESRVFQLKKVFINVDLDLLHRIELLPKPPAVEVIFEISEAEVLHNVEDSLEITEKWRANGFKFAIDDFGAGFISLPFIAQLVPDYIKIDRSTILQAASSKKFRNFLKDLVLTLKNYSKEGIIAEGIETQEELKVVQEMDIFLMQGFFLGKPQTFVK